ncbi:hypothetical protein JOC36_001511 [Weissella uvarum]|uniref:hypothetical protein n=1 Tax=Weissella uvarum TaxID=1479233 RepID=UPI001960D7B1|nr:hypothetical protein [Weissella uvarum]MBM7617918.1 hypothetical protein [Weissella uvarum]MCM0596086.1 hypothetical protein [Weissella uvarum]
MINWIKDKWSLIKELLAPREQKTIECGDAPVVINGNNRNCIFNIQMSANDQNEREISQDNHT